MRLNTQTRCCGERVGVNEEKLKIVVGGTAAVSLLGLIAGTPTGWLVLIPAALGGSQVATQIMRLKAKLWEESSRAGSYFYCRRCHRDIGIGEFFAD